MGKISLFLGSHKHLPYGSSADEFEELYRRELKPFITTLYKFPRVNFVLHYSGVLLQWIERRHPELILLLKNLVSRKQVEFLGGGFYEPLLPLIPLTDKLGQIEMMTTYLRKTFGKRPQGCLLPYNAWEQNLTSPLHACGMSYTFLNETIFTHVQGKSPYYSPCITEDQGKIITVFPVYSELGRTISVRNPSNVLAKLLEDSMPEQEKVFTIFTDKFFDRNTNELFYHDFFEALSASDPRIEFITPGRVFRQLKGFEKCYFPSFIEWTGGETFLPRKFLTDCPEANGIYAKMMFTHILINQLRGDKARKNTARGELWKAQGCDMFYPGSQNAPLIGFQTKRKAVYRALLEAEKISRETAFIPSLSAFDFNMDGRTAYIFQDEFINCYIDAAGASIFELDYLPRNWNYLDTYTGQKAEERGRKNKRCAFADILAHPEAALEHILHGEFRGFRFCGDEYYESCEISGNREKASFTLPARILGSLSVEGEKAFEAIEIEKTFSLEKDSLAVAYRLSNRHSRPERFKFMPSIDLSFPDDSKAFLKVFCIRGDSREEISPAGVFGGNSVVEFQDIKNEVSIRLAADRPFDAWIYSVRTGENTDEYQSTCIMPVMLIDLQPGEIWKTEFRLKIGLKSI
ncbi:MAG: DUF1926 domain-containing protein [Treponema sp.]|jgi:hypothetical protein|nr:DUF1926 domain-containing protein [Treponema sp.]